MPMSRSDMNAYAREEVADGLLEWEKKRFDDPNLSPDERDTIHRQVVRLRKILGKTTPNFWAHAMEKTK